MTVPKCYLIVNADDFGLSGGVNQGIIQAHEQGIVTSASLMVRGAAALHAAEYARNHPRLSVGLHLDLGEWIYREGQWTAKYQVVPANDEGAIAAEVSRQLEAFRRLLGRNPTHLDSHQHVHRNEPVLSIFRRQAEELSVPLRSFSTQVRYCGDFYGQTGEGEPYPEGISLETLLKNLANLPAGVTEMGCHPGDDEDLNSDYRSERMREIEVLCDPRARQSVMAMGIMLYAFTDLR
jgi:predicted glycoside hydrolase/deacetylase ChbG (UPF0249 family)